jgi:hypothetical protein
VLLFLYHYVCINCVAFTIRWNSRINICLLRPRSFRLWFAAFLDGGFVRSPLALSTTLYTSTVSAVSLLAMRTIFHRVAFSTESVFTLLARLGSSTFCADSLSTTIACRHASALSTPRFHWIASSTNGRFLVFHAVIFASTLLALTTTHKSTMITRISCRGCSNSQTYSSHNIDPCTHRIQGPIHRLFHHRNGPCIWHKSM